MTLCFGISRSSVPRAQHGRPARQPARRSLSVCGRHALAAGGTTALAGKRIDLRAAARLLRDRHSTRVFDDQRPIMLAELSRFLDSTARVQSQGRSNLDLGEGGPVVEYASRPYPFGRRQLGARTLSCSRQMRGTCTRISHYDAGGHALTSIGVRSHELDALLRGAEFAMGAPAAPQILITIAARFGRIAWKYSSLA